MSSKADVKCAQRRGLAEWVVMDEFNRRASNFDQGFERRIDEQSNKVPVVGPMCRGGDV